MSIVGFTFTKICVERKIEPKGKIDIHNNVGVKNVEAADLGFGKAKQDGLKFTFEFSSKYEPDVGEIIMTGEIMCVGEKNDEVIKGWKKNSQVPPELLAQILNTALMRCNIEALILSRDANLPPPINLPMIQKVTKDAKEYIG